VNDTERLYHDPAMRWVVGDRAITGSWGFSRPDGPVRDEMAEAAREPCRSRRSARPVEGQVHSRRSPRIIWPRSATSPDVPRNPHADRAAANAVRVSVKCRKRIDGQTTEEARLDGDRAERFSASAQSTDGFGRLPQPQRAVPSCRGCPKG